MMKIAEENVIKLFKILSLIFWTNKLECFLLGLSLTLKCFTRLKRFSSDKRSSLLLVDKEKCFVIFDPKLNIFIILVFFGKIS